MTTYQYIEVENTKVFYREAGELGKPTILLLHGFPSASHMFRNLIPILEKEYHIIAPDYPGFGNTISPDRNEFSYTFDNITRILELFIEKLKINKYVLYVFDYGAPIGFRLAKNHPERVNAIISQNGNIYREGLGEKWAAREEYWANPTPVKRESYRKAFAAETIRHQYIDGTEEGKVSPDGYMLDIAYVSRVGNDEIQLDLIFDYQNNIRLYPDFQQYLREHQPSLLAVWGKNDVSFIPEGAKAFKRDLPEAEIHLLNSGHFALETHVEEIGELILCFLKQLNL
ncbi:MAG: hydrolase [Eubacterium sp.]|jgi:pimeloyl-ACP methyl ester carboxylesterase|nr:hydrolase [Eubacterium sp.]